MQYISALMIDRDIGRLSCGNGYLKGQVRGSDYDQAFFNYLRSHALVCSEGKFVDMPVVGYEGLGVGVDPHFGAWVAVVHSNRTALFHKYVESAITKPKSAPISFEVSDNVYYGEFYQDPVGDVEVIDIRMEDCRVSAFGEGGSCVYFSNSDGELLGQYSEVYCTLYDLFIHLCRETGFNLMQYNYIQLGSSEQNWCVGIKLSQSLEAQRFYTKMMLDVSGNYMLPSPVLR